MGGWLAGGPFPFLRARWCNLAIITYAVDPSILAEHLPPRCVPDTVDGRAFTSLVAFDFLDTRVLGVRWPGFVNFPEINLRFYVRGPDQRRGVSFVKELVPRRLVALLARALYNEPYRAVPMRSTLERDEQRGVVRTTHVAEFAGRSNTIRVSGGSEMFRPADDTPDHFFKEHSWGYGKSRGGRLITYEVRHPVWETYRQARIDTLDWDFAAAYGTKLGFLGSAAPDSVVFAAGSEVQVFLKTVSSDDVYAN